MSNALWIFPAMVAAQLEYTRQPNKGEVMFSFLKRFRKKKTVRLLDGTPGTFLRQLRRYTELNYTRLVISKAAKPWTDVGCVVCGEMGGEYTIYGGVVDEDEDGETEVDICWPVHEKHFR